MQPTSAISDNEAAAPWPRSVEVLSRLVASRVSSTVRILRRQVRAFDDNFPEWRYLPNARNEWIDQAAILLALNLSSGQCGCGHHARSCRSASARCRCCVRGHALRAWNPAEVQLGIFLANAVRGSADTRSRSGTPFRTVWGDAFSRSMLRPALDRVGLEPLVIGDVEFRRCAACGNRFERPAGADVCPHDGLADSEKTNRREVVRHVLLYPEAGGYRRIRRVLCRECGGYFDTARVEQGEGCPLKECRLPEHQLRCPTRGCARWREVNDLISPCEGCGLFFTVKCHDCGTSRTVSEIMRDAGKCRCGQELLEALNERKLVLCRTQEVWVR